MSVDWRARARRRRRPAQKASLRFGRTWWGRAWIEALEQRAVLDPSRLPRGRTYARGGAVVQLSVDRGQAVALVRGSRSLPYRVLVRVRVFKAEEWSTVLEVIAGSAANAAALLDGDLRPQLAEELRSRGVDPLPQPGEVVPACTCPDWANPCKHAAAVCYLMANLLDEDPFNLLLLRGRAREDVLAGVRGLRATPATPGGPTSVSRSLTEQTVEARKLGVGTPRPVPLPGPPPERPGRPLLVSLDPPPESALKREELAALAMDAARRAWELATGQGDGGLNLSVDADLARLAADRLGTPAFTDLAARAGIDAHSLSRLAVAWRSGGAEGVEVLLNPWDPVADDLHDGMAAIAESGHQGRRWRNRVIMPGGGLQLRLGRSGFWYLLRKVGTAWELRDPPQAEPARFFALDGASE